LTATIHVQRCDPAPLFFPIAVRVEPESTGQNSEGLRFRHGPVTIFY